MPESRSIPAPKGLSVGGKRCWKQVTSAYDLRPDERILLENACRTVDRIAELDAAMVGQPLISKGSMGQEREHPLLSEARQQRTLLRQLFAQLKLPDADAGHGKMNQHREAGMSRWAAAHGSNDSRWEYGR